MAELDVSDLAIHACRKMYDKGAEELRLLEMPEGGALFDYVILANGRSERQVATLIDEVYHFCKRHDIPHQPVEGEAGWKLIDCFGVVVHAFTEDMRAYYDLDNLWPEAADIDVEDGLKHIPDIDDAPAVN